MKPKFRRILKNSLPAFVIIPAMAGLAHAATITPDGVGNVTVTNPVDSGAHNIVTGFGFVPPIPAGDRAILIGAGVTLNPVGADVISIQVFDAVGANYTITNNGTLVADGGNDGIDTIDQVDARPNITVINTGTISGVHAIRANNMLDLTNSGTLTGTGIASASVFAKNGGTIVNTGTGSIVGLVHGIQSENASGTLNVTNSNDIIGQNFTGILTPGTLNLTNNWTLASGKALVRGNTNGVDAGANSIINNAGEISGITANGVVLGNSGTVNNLTTFDPFFPFGPLLGGSILGADNGILAGDNLTVLNQNLSLISGESGNGIDAGSGASITNNQGATIYGGNDGINAGPGSTIVNNGTITGDSGDGIDIDGVGAATTITNTGTISGGDSGIDGSGSSEIVVNSGSISGGSNAMSLGGGDDTVTLQLGSLVQGDILGGSGTDSLFFTGGLTAPGGTGNLVQGDVLGFNLIEKSGGGVALIGAPGDPLFSVEADTINITGGGLYINGDITGDSVGQTTINANGAAIGGLGVWNANIAILSGGISAGAIPINLDVNPVNAVGPLTITGDVTHSAGSFIRMDIVPGTAIIDGVNSDLIVQTGVGNTYNVSGGNLRISATDNNSVISDGTYTIIDSEEAIAGLGGFGTIGMQFNPNVNGSDSGFIGTEVFNTGVSNLDTVFTNFFVTPGLSFDGTNLVMIVQHDFENLPGLSANQSSLGAALDASVGNGNALMQDFIAALDYSNLGAVQDTLASLSPEGHFGLVTGVVNSNYRLHRMAQDHLARSRSGGSTTMTTPDSVDAKGHVIPGGTSVVSNANRGSFWGSLSYDHQDYDGGPRATSFDGETGAITAGFDYRVAPDLLLGVMLDGSTSDNDFTGGSADVDSFRIAAYGTWGQSLGLYSDFLLGYGSHDLSLTQSFGGILGGVGRSATDADSLQALVTVGYAMGNEELKHGPFAGLEYQNVDVDGFTRSGAIPVGVAGYDVDSLRGLVGYRVNADYGTFKPYASIAYAHEFKDGSTSTTATLPGGASFRVAGAEQGSAILLGLGTGISLTSNLSLDVGYRGEISVDDEGMDSHGATVGAKWSF